MDPPAPFHPSGTRRVRDTVRVGVGVLVIAKQQQQQDSTSKVWAGFRKESHGASKLALPGGHLELNESWADCAAREVEEEMGLTLVPSSIRFFHATNDVMLEEEKHYVTLFMVATPSDPEQLPTNREPEKCEGWDTYSVEGLLEQNDRLFLPLQNLLREKRAELEALLLE